MTNIITPDSAPKISKRQEIQKQVDTTATKIQQKEPDRTPPSIIQQARDKVAAELVRGRLRTEKAEAEKLARVDPLTELQNRRRFDEQLSAEVQRARRTGKPLWLVEWDVDHFKQVNTDYEHKGGDAVLRKMKELETREEEPISRVGGEEFTQLLNENITEDNVIHVIERHARAFRRLSEQALTETIPATGAVDPKKYATLSFGATLLQDTDDPTTFMERANKLMNEAKNSGRNKAIINNGTETRIIADLAS